MFVQKRKNTFIQQECIQLIESDNKHFWRQKKDLCFIKMLLVNFLFIKESWKNIKAAQLFSPLITCIISKSFIYI